MYTKKLNNIKSKFLKSLEGTDDTFRTKRIIDYFNWLWKKLEECEDQESTNVLRKHIVDVFVELDRPNEQWEKIFIANNTRKTYYISNWGRLKSLYKGKEKILRPSININSLYFQYCNIGTTAHRLVAEYFIPNPENKPIVEYISTNKILPIEDNLIWDDYYTNDTDIQTIEKKIIEINGKNITVYSDGTIEWITTFKSGRQHIYKSRGTKNKNGYMTTFVNGKFYYIHQLVAEAFIPNPEHKDEIDHINTDRSDNRVENLRWCTSKENHNNPLTLESHKRANRKYWYGRRGSKHPNSIPILGTNKTTGKTMEFSSATEAARVLGIIQTNITACCRGRQKSTGGWEWKYAV